METVFSIPCEQGTEMPQAPSTHKSRSKRIDWDGAWKEAIQQLFQPFLELLFPRVAALIDWAQEPVFLEQELRQVTRRARRGKGAVDKLVRVRLRDGRQVSLLIHVEFQNQFDPDLSERLYAYNVGIYSLLREKVITLAVLGDGDPQWRPTEFGYADAEFEARMRFPVAKLLDYEASWATLEQSANPFAVFVMAHLKTLATVRKLESRLEWKLRLSKALYDRSYDVGEIQQLLDFIDWLMVLDDRREAHFDAAIRQYEEEKTMPTLSPMQKRFAAIGKQEGKQEGVLLTFHENILEILNLRFGPVPMDLSEAVQEVEDGRLLRSLHLAAVQVTSLDEFRRLL